MAEYNFWDDRTLGNDDAMWCPLMDYYCNDQCCESCEHYIAFCEFYHIDFFSEKEEA